MPIYEYYSKGCGETYEKIFTSFKGPPDKIFCEDCEQEAPRIISAPTHRLMEPIQITNLVVLNRR